MFWECARHWKGGAIEFVVRHDFFFPYYGFEWVSLWPENGMYIHFAVIAVLALFVAIGFLYALLSTRISAGSASVRASGTIVLR